MTPEAPSSLAAAGGNWQTLSDTSTTGNTVHKEQVKLEFQGISACTTDFFWGTMHNGKHRPGLVYVAEQSLPKGIWWHFRAWGRTDKTESVGNSAALGWDAFSPAWGPWHSCPSEDLQEQLPGAAKGQLVAGEVQMPRATSEHVCTWGLLSQHMLQHLSQLRLPQ